MEDLKRLSNMLKQRIALEVTIDIVILLQLIIEKTVKG